MIVDLNEKTESGWFDLEGGGRVHLRLLDITDIRDMRKACLKTVPEYPKLDGKYQRFEGQEFDNDLWNEMLWDRTIIGWEGIFDRDERPIPVTKERKVLLMMRASEFVKVYEEGIKALKAAEEARAEAAEKN
jgi:hypothetical protein